METPEIFEIKLNSALKPEKVLEEIGYRTDTITQRDDIIRCFCPIHKESIFRSLSIQIDKKTYKCGYTLCPGFRGDNLLDLYSKAKGISKKDSIQFWSVKLNIPIAQPIIGNVPDEIQTQSKKQVLTPKLEEQVAQALQDLDNNPENKELRVKLADLYIRLNDLPSAIDHYMALAMQYISSNSLQDSIIYLEEILVLESSNIKAQELLGQCYSSIGNRDGSIKFLSSAASSYVKTKQFDKALELYNELSRYDPLEPKWKYELSNLLIKLERLPDAVRELKLLADFHIQRGQLSEAFNLYEMIISLTPQDMDIKRRAISAAQRLNMPEQVVHYGLELVDSLLSAGNILGAIESLQQALSESPANISLRKKLVEVLLQSGSTDEAIHQLGALAQLYLDKEEYESAAGTYQQLAGIQPNNLSLYEKLATLYEKLGFSKELIDVYTHIAAFNLSQRAIEPAINALKKALEIDPGNTQAQKALASAYIREKSQTKATDVLISLAKRYMQEGDIDRARRSFDRILEFNPTALAAHEGLIEIYRKQGNANDEVKHLCEIVEIYRQRDEFKPALEKLWEALRLHTPQVEPLQIQARIYKQLGSIPKSIASYYKLSKTLVNQDRLAEAVDAIQQALNLNGSLPKLRGQLAQLYIQMGLRGDALSELRNLGNYYKKNNNLDKAVNVLEKARVIDPANLSILESLAQIYESTKVSDKAKPIYSNLAQVFYDKGLLDDAIDCYQKVLKIEPDALDAITGLTSCYMDIGAVSEATSQFRSMVVIYRKQRLYGEAMDCCQQVLQLDSHNTEFQQILIDIYLEVGEQKEAITQMLILADIFRQKQEFDNGLGIYKKILTLSPESLSVYPALGEIYQTTGKIKEASALFRKYMAICQNKGLQDEVILAYPKLAELEPRNLTVREELAEIYHKNSQTMDCLMEFDVIASLYLDKKNYEKVIETYTKMKQIDPKNEEINKALSQVKQLAKAKI